jgi:hypothetical protein
MAVGGGVDISTEQRRSDGELEPSAYSPAGSARATRKVIRGFGRSRPGRVLLVALVAFLLVGPVLSVLLLAGR